MSTADTTKKASAPKELRYDVELTRAIKENHGKMILDAKWCPFKDGEAYYATVGANQVNIYDCEVRGNFISTLFNYRNWHLQTMRTKNIVWKENLEKKHPEELEKKTFNAVCWMRRFRDFWLCAADNEKQLHILSVVFAKCTKIIKLEHTAVELTAHPKWPNIVCVTDEKHNCFFMNVLNEEVILKLDDKVTLLRFSPSADKFCVVLSNGSVREFSQSVVRGDDSKMDEDEDGEDKGEKRLTATALRTHKMADRGGHIADMHYRSETAIIVGNEDGEFKLTDMTTGTLEHQWKAVGPIERGSVCRFDVNSTGDCVVYGNAAHQVQIYDVEQKKYVRRVETGRGRKLPFRFATFCKNHPQSVMLVCDQIIMKFDPFELVREYFPSTSDFAVQSRNGQKTFREVMVVNYEAEQAQKEAQKQKEVEV